MKRPERIAGTKDYMGAEATRLLRLGEACAANFDAYGYERIVLPIFEQSDIFLERSGEEIRSRMYIFSDPRSKAEICLRPEMTISVARAYLERMSARRLPVRLSYQGDVFRYEKVREGRYRQFLQAGVEMIGSDNRIAADAEIVALAVAATRRAGLDEIHLLLGDLELAAEFINSLPVTNEVRARLTETFWRRGAFDRLLRRLSESMAQGQTTDTTARELGELLASLGEARSRALVREMLALFVEKEVGHRSLDEIAENFLSRFTAARSLQIPQDCLDAMEEYLTIAGAPDVVLSQVESLLARLGQTTGVAWEAAHRRFELLKAQDALPANARLDLGFRRGIEYYTGFIFEIHCERLGAVSQICGGGRYDRLLSSLGATRQIPAVGFALGVNRLLLALENSTAKEVGETNQVDAVMVCVGEVEESFAWRVADICRRTGWRVRADFEPRKLKAVLGQIAEERIPFAILVGEDEARNDSVRIKDMQAHSETVIGIRQLEEYVYTHQKRS